MRSLYKKLLKLATPRNFQLVSEEERDKIRSLTGKLISEPYSEELFNNLHKYCLDILEEKGIESGLLRKVNRYESFNKEIEFWVKLQYRESLFIITDSLMVDYNEDNSIVNNLHLMRKRELTRPLNPNKSLREQCQIHPAILRIMGADKKYKIIKYKR